MTFAPIILVLLSFSPLAEDGPIATPKAVEKPKTTEKPKAADKINVYKVGSLPPLVKQSLPDEFIVPAVEVVGTEESYRIGDMIVLSIKPIDKIPDNLKAAIFSWTVLPAPEKVVLWPDNTKILFGSGSIEQEYTIILNSTFTFVNEQNAIEHRAITTINKCKVTGQPNSIKDASVTITKIQDFKNKIKSSFTLIKKEGITEEQIKADVIKLAVSFRKLSAVIENQKNLSEQTILTMQTQDNSDALGVDMPFFTDWFDNLSKELKINFGDSKVDRQERAEIYRIVASILESY